MKTEHTPGPWRVQRTVTGEKCAIEFAGLNSDGLKKFNVFVESPLYVLAGVAGIGADECLANATLIASAPSLLSENARLRGILGRVIEYVDEYVNSDDADLDRIASVADEARSALSGSKESPEPLAAVLEVDAKVREVKLREALTELANVAASINDNNRAGIEPEAEDWSALHTATQEARAALQGGGL